VYGIDSVTPTISKIMKIPIPIGSTAKPINEILTATKNIIGNNTIEKMLLYAPDAIGEKLFQEYKNEFKHVIEAAPIQVKMLSMRPSYTPVCYGSMFTGLRPEEHGILKYEKPVLKCDTLFDAAARTGKKVAIVATKNSSIDLIFKNRPIDYFTEEYDPYVEQRVIELLEDSNHDLIIAYNQEYDDKMHNSTPTSSEAIMAFRKHLKTFKRFNEAFNKFYDKKNRVIAFLPDHGAHIDSESGKGSHGTNLPEDMEVRHFWGIIKG
jgi:hypothetical protein